MRWWDIGWLLIRWYYLWLVCVVYAIVPQGMIATKVCSVFLFSSASKYWNVSLIISVRFLCLWLLPSSLTRFFTAYRRGRKVLWSGTWIWWDFWNCDNIISPPSAGHHDLRSTPTAWSPPSRYTEIPIPKLILSQYHMFD
jgi:hypothetical protein